MLWKVSPPNYKDLPSSSMTSQKKWYRLVEEEIHSRLTSLSIAINPWSHMDGWKSELLLRWQEMCSSSYYYYFTYYIVVFETSAQWAKTLKKIEIMISALHSLGHSAWKKCQITLFLIVQPKHFFQNKHFPEFMLIVPCATTAVTTQYYGWLRLSNGCSNKMGSL